MWKRIRYFFNRRQFDRDLADEMRLHLDLRAETEGESAARRRFGNVTHVAESSRAVWGWNFLETLAHDLRYGLRNLRANPGFAATAILSLALGIGANTAIFSILNAVMLRSLPIEDPQRLVALEAGGGGGEFTNPIWEQVRDRQQAFAGSLAFSGNRFDLSEGGESHFAQGLWVSGDFFRVLGVPAIRGRVFTPDDDRHGGGRSGPVAVISYGFWQRQFSGDPDIVGKPVRLDRHQFTIVGVTPPWFTGLDLDQHYDVAIPIGCEPVLHTDRSALEARSWWWLRILGRLQPGESIQQAEARMKALAPEVNRATLPDWDAHGQQEYLKRSFNLRPAATGFSDTGHQYRTALFTVMAVVGLVLLIACANVANLLLSRAAARHREISIRLAIGAARARVMRQLLSESLLLAAFGAAGGLILAFWGSRLLVHLISTSANALQLDVSPDWRVLAFAIGMTLLTGLLFGLAPAWRATRVAANQILKEHSRGATSGRSALGSILITGQVALSLVLLVGAGLFLSTFRNLLTVDLGFRPHDVLLAEADLMQTNIPRAQRTNTYREIVDRLRAIPGVTAASSSALTPVSHSGWNNVLSPEGYAGKEDDALSWFNRVSAGYFQTLGTPILMGRDFSSRDDLSAPLVMIINDTAARRFFAGKNPIGKIIRAEAAEPGKQSAYQVIGVVKDAKYDSVQEDRSPTVYLSAAQDSEPWPGVTFEVRSEQPLQALTPAVRATIGSVNRGISLEFRSFETQINESLLQPRMVALLAGFFGALALVLAMIGLYGVTAYGVARRQAEIGIRMALGAQPASVVWLVLREVAVVLIIGAAIGLGASLAAGRLVSSLLYGVNANDAAPLVLAAVLLGAAAGIAAYLPARRAARLDPMSALREE